MITRKLLVDEVHWLDMKSLKKMGVFTRGSNVRWTSRWTCRGEESGSVGYHLVEDSSGGLALRFIYTLTEPYTGKKTDFDYRVHLDSTPCNYGGRRWWFICPLRARPNCVRRCRVIYITPYNYTFGCRECSDLTYECRRKHRDYYYERLHKPQARHDKALKNLRSRSPKKRALARRELEWTRGQFEEFDRLADLRLAKLMNKAK
ncbi:hypothetical protein GWO09_14770 [candidate division KSB1 bacterium]|nr:hypothetical protein [candidate division KSB1 bacterium]